MRTKTLQEHEELVTANGRDYQCLFECDTYGGYLVTCEDLPPLMTYGETLAEARANAIEELVALADYRSGAEQVLRPEQW
jgi:hypothetical protein